MGIMARNRIKALREERGMSQEQLGERVGRTKSTISRIEDETTSLDIDLARKIADALDCTVAAVLDIEMSGVERPLDGFRENEVARYTTTANDPFARLESSHRYLMDVRTHALAMHGILFGDIVLVDDSAEACRNPLPLATVVVQYNENPGRSENTVELLRQFVPPSLLITNAGEKNARPIDMSIEDAHIVGVVTWSGRRHR